MMTPIIIIIISYILNALMDSIDHAKGSEDLYEIWHILKWFSYATPFVYIFIITGIRWYWWIPIAAGLWITWESVYYNARYFRFYRLDNLLRINWLYKILKWKL